MQLPREESVPWTETFGTTEEVRCVLVPIWLKEGAEEDIKKLGKDAYEAIEGWVNNYYKDISPNFKSEKSVSYKDKKFPHLNIYGKIDLVEYLGGDFIRVTDFKTGSSKTKNIIL